MVKETSKVKKKRSSTELYKILPLSVKQDICFVEFISCVRVLLEDLVEEFIRHNNSISFNEWKKIWKEKVMSGLFHLEFAYGNANSVHQCILQAALELLTTSIHEISSYETQQHYKRLFASLFCLYCCYFTQLSKPKFKIIVDPSDWTKLMSFEQLNNKAKVYFPLASKEAIEMLRSLVKKDAFMKCLKGFKYEIEVKRKVYEEQKRSGIEVLVPFRTIKPQNEDLVVTALHENVTSDKKISMATVNHIESLNERYSTLMKKLLDQPTKRRNAGGRGSARFMTTAGGKLAEQQQAKHKQQMECMNRYVKMLGGFVKSTPEGSVNGVEQQSLTPVYSDLTALSSTSAIFQAQIAVDDEEDDFDALQAELEVEGQSSIARVTASRTPVPAQAPSLQTEQLHAIPIKKTAPTKPKAGTLQQSSDKKKKSNTIEVSSDSDDALAELENELSASIGTELASVPEPIVLAPTTIRKSARRRANPIRNKSSKNAKSDDNEGDELLLALEEELQAAGRDFTSTTKTRVNTAGTQSTISNITKKTPRRSITQKNGVATTENTKSNTTRSGRQIVRPSTEVKRRRTRKQVVNSTRSSDVTKILPQEVSTPSKTSQDSETDDDTLLAALEQELETTPTLVTPLPVSTRTRSGSLPPANFEIEEEDDDEMAALEAELNSII